jgi:hypothetical protein
MLLMSFSVSLNRYVFFCHIIGPSNVSSYIILTVLLTYSVSSLLQENNVICIEENTLVLHMQKDSVVCGEQMSRYCFFGI